MKLIAKTDDYSMKVESSKFKYANELVSKGLAVVIPISTGGGELALNEAGIQFMESEIPYASNSSGNPDV